VTFRLNDSLPREVLEAWIAERENIVLRAQANGRALSRFELQRLEALHSERIEHYLDQGAGQCVLRDDRAAEIVWNALSHFNGQRYDLLARCVMPNHVHVVVHPLPRQDLSRILHSWKSFTSNEINRLLARTGTLWQPEYYDHLVRDADDLERCIRYVVDNPDRAGLRGWRWVEAAG
jgi:REP element-mobilizing transposase RayT